jgi:hypothetical protein
LRSRLKKFQILKRYLVGCDKSLRHSGTLGEPRQGQQARRRAIQPTDNPESGGCLVTAYAASTPLYGNERFKLNSNPNSNFQPRERSRRSNACIRYTSTRPTHQLTGHRQKGRASKGPNGDAGRVQSYNRRAAPIRPGPGEIIKSMSASHGEKYGHPTSTSVRTSTTDPEPSCRYPSHKEPRKPMAGTIHPSLARVFGGRRRGE